jgi:hypothetical protein
MQTYEIRILNDDLTSNTIIEQQYTSDTAALRAARQFAESRPYEVWRGLTCIHWTGSRHKPSPKPQDRPTA